MYTLIRFNSYNHQICIFLKSHCVLKYVWHKGYLCAYNRFGILYKICTLFWYPYRLLLFSLMHL